MSTHPSHADLPENNLIGNILNPDVEDFFNLRADIGKSVSAPPIHFPQLMFSPTLKPKKSEVPESFSFDNQNDAKQSTGPLLSFLSQRNQLIRSTSFQPSQSLEEELFHQQNYPNLQTNSFMPIVQRSHSQNFHQPNNVQTTQNTPFYAHHQNPMSRTSPESPLRSPTQPSNYHIQQQDNSPGYYPPPNIRFGPISPYAQFAQENPELEENFLLNSPSGSYFSQNGEYYPYQMNYPGSTNHYMLSREDAGYTNNKILQPQFDKNINRKPSYPPMNPYGSQNYNYSPENNPYPNPNLKKSFKDREGSFSNHQNKKQSSKYSANPKGSLSSQSTPFRENTHPNAKNYHPSSQKTRPKSSSANVNIQHMLANVSEASKDQNGSRIIQQYFEGAARDERDMIFQQVMEHANTLFTDMFGNYVIQKILQLGTLHQKLRIYELMKGKVFALSQHMYSCRIVQKALEEFSNNGLIQDQILKELGADILSLIQNQNGNHVVQKCFETIPSEKLRFIIDKITENIDKLSFHAFECRIIQKILEYSTFEQVSELMKTIMERCFECCQSQYGNYVMQHVLEKGSATEKDKLLEVLANNFVKLSLDKFASNVTEKSIIHSNAEYRKIIVEKLINTKYEEKLSLLVLINDQYGNYVIQRLFEYSDKGVRRAIFDTLVNKENFEEARKTGFGQHVSSHIEKLMNIQKM